MNNTLPQVSKIVTALAPIGTNAERTGDYIKLNHGDKLIIVCELTWAVAAASAIRVEQATNAAAAGTKVITNNMKIWSNLDTGTTDTLVRRTNAVNYSTGDGTTPKLIVFQVDPSSLDIAGGFNWVTVIAGTSAQATNVISATYFIVNHRYQQATPPTAIL